MRMRGGAADAPARTDRLTPVAGRSRNWGAPKAAPRAGTRAGAAGVSAKTGRAALTVAALEPRANTVAGVCRTAGVADCACVCATVGAAGCACTGRAAGCKWPEKGTCRNRHDTDRGQSHCQAESSRPVPQDAPISPPRMRRGPAHALWVHGAAGLASGKGVSYAPHFTASIDLSMQADVPLNAGTAMRNRPARCTAAGTCGTRRAARTTAASLR